MNQKVGGILAKFAPKKRKNYHHGDTSPSVYENDSL